MENAVISASVQRNVATRSDRDGRFTLTGVKSGQKITINAEQSEQQLHSSINLVVTPDVSVDIIMEKYDTTRAEGRVIDAHGSPVSGIDISLYSMDNKAGPGMSTSVAVSGENGSFSIPGLKIGNEYRIMISKGRSMTELFVAKAAMEPFELALP